MDKRLHFIRGLVAANRRRVEATGEVASSMDEAVEWLDQENPLAWLEAVLIAAEARSEIPDWAAEMATAFAFDALNSGFLGAKGRSNNVLKADIAANTAIVRHDAVKTIIYGNTNKDEGFGLKGSAFRLYRYLQINEASMNEFERVLERDPLKVVSHAFPIAERLLAGTPAQGSIRAIEESYRSVEIDFNAVAAKLLPHRAAAYMFALERARQKD
ncbi:hypothetical protein ACWCOP_00840 [Maricaulaceae bacterium MS644]